MQTATITAKTNRRRRARWMVIDLAHITTIRSMKNIIAIEPPSEVHHFDYIPGRT